MPTKYIHYTEEGPVWPSGLRMYNLDGTVALGRECCLDRCHCCEQDRPQHWESIIVEVWQVLDCPDVPASGNCPCASDWVNTEWELLSKHDHVDDTGWCFYEYEDTEVFCTIPGFPDEVFRQIRATLGGPTGIYPNGSGEFHARYIGASEDYAFWSRRGWFCNRGDIISNLSCPCPDPPGFDCHYGCDGYVVLNELIV